MIRIVLDKKKNGYRFTITEKSMLGSWKECTLEILEGKKLVEKHQSKFPNALFKHIHDFADKHGIDGYEIVKRLYT